MITTIEWVGLETTTREECEIALDPEGVVVRSVIHSDDWTCTYILRATSAWEYISLDMNANGMALRIERDDDGWRVDGQPRPDLQDAHEIDISASPLTNTLPIRRLNLDVGQSAEILTAYIAVPELDVSSSPQQYTRLSENQYLYESLDSDFSTTITVDDDGLVTDYPGLFSRG